MVGLATEVFDEHMRGPNQLKRRRDDIKITAEEMLRVHGGARTERGLRENIRVGVQYIEAWLRGRGAVPLYNLMEDAATAEISRAQVWQWIRLRAPLDDGRTVTRGLFQQVLTDEMNTLRQTLTPAVYDKGRFPEAIKLFADMSLAEEFAEFLTLPAYRMLEA